MIQTSHHKIIYPVFGLYTDWMLHRRFRRITLTGSLPEQGSAILLISNHTSWWDGFWNFHFAKQVLHRRFHVMIAETQLKKHSFMKRIGGFSIKKGSRDTMDSLYYASRLLSDPQNMVLIYPQGKIVSAYQDTFRFQNGIKHILHNRNNEVCTMMVAWFTETINWKKPSLWGYYQTCDPNSDIEKSYQIFYRETLARHIQNTSE